MPGEASALYARWWQLETWLRALLYVERSAHSGRNWAEGLPANTAQREQKDLAGDYMLSPDSQARLAYLDAGPLLDVVIPTDWPLYSDSLLDNLDVWKGRSAELLRIRHRIGHCRRPHSDDLNRLEQTLSDLEPGAFRAVSAYNERATPHPELDDPFVAAWIRREHVDAMRLIDHASRQYEIDLQITYSRRPWAEKLEDQSPISGTAGFLWHVSFVFRGGRPLDLRSFWRQAMEREPDSAVVYLTAIDPFDIEFSFAAVDDPKAVSDEVGRIFDRILQNRVLNPPASTLSRAVAFSESWRREHQDLDARVQLGTPWSIVDRTTTPVTLFGP